MNGIHDMGGMHGFGPVAIERGEPVFHADWEAKVLALTLAVGGLGCWNIDASRRAREQIPPAAYLDYGYYERWLDALERLLVETGLVTAEELHSGAGASEPPQAAPLDAAAARDMLRRGGPSRRPSGRQPRFGPGDAVRARNRHPAGHTRLPRYARGHEGTVVDCQGVHVLPDSNAHFQGEQPEPLYAVRFAARELWGPQAAATDSITLNLWESYLEAR